MKRRSEVRLTLPEARHLSSRRNKPPSMPKRLIRQRRSFCVVRARDRDSKSSQSRGVVAFTNKLQLHRSRRRQRRCELEHGIVSLSLPAVNRPAALQIVVNRTSLSANVIIERGI